MCCSSVNGYQLVIYIKRAFNSGHKPRFNVAKAFVASASVGNIAPFGSRVLESERGSTRDAIMIIKETNSHP